MSKSRVLTRIVMLLAGGVAVVAAGCSGGGSSSGGTVPDGDGTATPATSGGETPSGGGAAEIQGTFVTGEGPKTLADAKGKVVIIDFWATYCQPCKKSFPKYQELVEQFGGDLAGPEEDADVLHHRQRRQHRAHARRLRERRRREDRRRGEKAAGEVSATTPSGRRHTACRRG
jgi:hypothetical protein